MFFRDNVWPWVMYRKSCNMVLKYKHNHAVTIIIIVIIMNLEDKIWCFALEKMPWESV
jgi:hypothetical protein